ncbi:MAG: hypothetical protein V3T30_07930, partial [Thermodesulfobacteriota bacterium]
MEILFLIIKIAFVLGFLFVGYFFIVTRISLIVQAITGKEDSSSHVYWIYRNRFLIWLTDRQLLISAILLFNYNKLV